MKITVHKCMKTKTYETFASDTQHCNIKKVKVILHKESMLIMHAIEKFEFKHV